MPDKRQSIILGTALVTLLSTSYLGLINLLCCAGVWIGALVTVWHYTSNNELTLAGGQGAVLGLTVGILGAALAAVLNYVLMRMGVRPDLVLGQAILDMFADGMPDAQYDEARERLMQDPTIGSLLINSAVSLALSAGIGAIGGAIGASVFKKGGDEPTYPAG
jgi:hypothetical protein